MYDWIKLLYFWEDKIYHMASSVSGQDEPNHMLWLAAWVGKMELSNAALDYPPCPARDISPKAKW